MNWVQLGIGNHSSNTNGRKGISIEMFSIAEQRTEEKTRQEGREGEMKEG